MPTSGYRELCLKKLESFESEYKKGGRPRDPLINAFNLCINNHISLPNWVVDGVRYIFNSSVLDKHLLSLEKTYQSENYGALKDAVYLCESYDKPLPKWANLALYKTFSELANGNQAIIKKWSAWFRQYRQDMADYEIYDTVRDAREHSAEWKDAYYIAGGIISNKLEEDGGVKSGTIKKTYQRVCDRLKDRPLRYYLLITFQKRKDCRPYNIDLWVKLHEIIRLGKPKGIKKSID